MRLYRFMVIVETMVPADVPPSDHMEQLLELLELGGDTKVEVRQWYDVIPGDQHRHDF